MTSPHSATLIGERDLIDNDIDIDSCPPTRLPPARRAGVQPRLRAVKAEDSQKRREVRGRYAVKERQFCKALRSFAKFNEVQQSLLTK
jgi:hypothetical protein